MRWEWRPAAMALVASVLLAGCGADFQTSSSSSCSASETTSPDWVFVLLLSAGTVALFSGLVWVMFLPGAIKGPPKPRVKHWWSTAYLVFMALLAAYTLYSSRDIWTQTPGRYIDAGSLGLSALILGGVFVAVRRHRATGVWPSGRQAPWGLFWLLPVIFLAAAGSAVWAFVTIVSSTVPVPC